MTRVNRAVTSLLTYRSAIAASAAAVLVVAIAGHSNPAAAVDPVQLFGTPSAWGPDGLGYVHVVGQVVNTSNTDNASLIRINYTLYSDVAKTQEIGHDYAFVESMGATTLAPQETSPFQAIMHAPTYKSFSITSVTSAVAPTLPDQNFTITPPIPPPPCADFADPDHLCGTVTNHNSSSVDFVRVIFAFFKGTDSNGNPMLVDEDALYLNTDESSSLAKNGSGDFELTRSEGAPDYTSFTWFAESSTTVPEVPTNVTGVPGNGKVTVSWSAPPTDGGRPITSYTVTSSPDSGHPQGVTVSTADGNTTSIAVTGLQNGTSYTFTVTATNALGTGFPSAASDAQVPFTVPGPPTGVTATAGNGSATVQWTAPFNGGRPITRYTVTSSPGGVTASTADGTSTSVVVPGLTVGASYTFTVTATNVAGTSAPSAASNQVTIAHAPGAPTAVTAKPMDSGALVSWTAPADPGSPAAITYTVTSSPGGFTTQVAATKTSAMVSGLTNGTSYTFTVTAANSNGPGPASAASNAVTPAIGPSAPVLTSATAGPGSATVNWNASSTRGGSAIAGYTVNASPGSMTVPTGAGATSAVVGGLGSGTYTFTVTATNAAGILSPPSNTSSQVTVTAAGQYHPLAPFRILDTRDGTGGINGPVFGGTTIDVTILGQGGVPSDAATVAAVVLNVTVDQTTAPSFLTVYPDGMPRPNASNLNFVANKTVPNLVVVALGTNHKVRVYNHLGSTQVIIDVEGWISTPEATAGTAGLYRSLVPARVMDTRIGFGGSFKLLPGQTVNLKVTDAGDGVPATGVSAVVMNVTVANPSGPGYLTVFPTGHSRPNASNVNFVGGQLVPNRVIVPVGTGGQVSIFNFVTSYTDVIVDVNGYFTDGSDPSAVLGEFTGSAPTRILDTRNGIGPLGGNQTYTLAVIGTGMCPANTSAVVLNVTVANTTNSSFLRVRPSDGQSQTSDLNWTAGKLIPNLVIVKPGADGNVALYNLAGNVDLIVDLSGCYN